MIEKIFKEYDIFYRAFEKKFHKIMDELEAHVEKERKIMFAQTPEQYKRFLDDMFFTWGLTLLFWIISTAIDLYFFPVDLKFPSIFFQLIPKSHMFPPILKIRNVFDDYRDIDRDFIWPEFNVQEIIQDILYP